MLVTNHKVSPRAKTALRENFTRERRSLWPLTQCVFAPHSGRKFGSRISFTLLIFHVVAFAAASTTGCASKNWIGQEIALPADRARSTIIPELRAAATRWLAAHEALMSAAPASTARVEESLKYLGVKYTATHDEKLNINAEMSEEISAVREPTEKSIQALQEKEWAEARSDLDTMRTEILRASRDRINVVEGKQRKIRDQRAEISSTLSKGNADQPAIFASNAVNWTVLGLQLLDTGLSEPDIKRMGIFSDLDGKSSPPPLAALDAVEQRFFDSALANYCELTWGKPWAGPSGPLDYYKRWNFERNESEIGERRGASNGSSAALLRSAATLNRAFVLEAMIRSRGGNSTPWRINETSYYIAELENCARSLPQGADRRELLKLVSSYRAQWAPKKTPPQDEPPATTANEPQKDQ